MKSTTRLRKTRVPNLFRHANGRFWIRFRIGQAKEIERSLHTKIEAEARARMGIEMTRLRAVAGRLDNPAMTLGQAAEIYLAGKKEAVKLKQRSKDFRAETVAVIRAHWPRMDFTRVDKISEQECEEFAGRVRNHVTKRGRPYWPGRINGVLESLRGIFQVAVRARVIDRNPAFWPGDKGSMLKRMRIPKKQREIPSRELFARILERLAARRERRFAALWVRGCAMTGIRPNEARHCVPGDLNVANGTLRVRVTKNGLERVIYLNPPAREFFSAHPFEVFTAFKKSPRRALGTVSRELGIARMTPYLFRHLFSARVDEAGAHLMFGVQQMGHQDQGQTRRQFYTQEPTEEFLRREAEKVREF